MKNLSSYKIFLITISLLFQSVLINAQNFNVQLSDDVLSNALGNEIIFDFHITNESNSELTLYFVRVKNQLPDDWSSSLCFDACFAPFLDSVATSENFNSSPIVAGETREFSVHVFPLTNEGEANITIEIGIEGNQASAKQFELTAKTVVTKIAEADVTVSTFQLDQNYPNPFNPNTIIKFSLPEAGQVSLKIFDALGRNVVTLVDEFYSGGNHSVEFIGENLSSGVYIYRLQTGNLITSKKMVLEK